MIQSYFFRYHSNEIREFLNKTGQKVIFSTYQSSPKIVEAQKGKSVGEFDCVTLENSYPGINQIFKISNDGKKDRVGLDTKKNTKQIKELF